MLVALPNIPLFGNAEPYTTSNRCKKSNNLEERKEYDIDIFVSSKEEGA